MNNKPPPKIQAFGFSIPDDKIQTPPIMNSVKTSSPFIQGQPASRSVGDIAVQLAKDNILRERKRQPKVNQKTLP
jgi:hypothetical protein